jgi:hypothetical protein
MNYITLWNQGLLLYLEQHSMRFPVEVQPMKGRILKCADVTFRAITNVEDVIDRSQWRYRRILFALPPKAISRKN